MKQLSSPLKKLGFMLAVTSIVLCFGVATHEQKASALSGSEFNASNIIDDGVFFNRESMSVTDIQNFLNAKVSVCDTNGTQPYAGTTRANYGTQRGYPPPYTCLKDYAQAVPTKSADAYCSGSIGSGTKSSAQIIYDVSQACGVSPKVLLVLLQKEQSLVTDDWPWSIQYRSATGFGCPDTAACDSTYYGYFNQVYNAARQYQRYIVQADYFNYAAGRTSYVQYNPDAGCGGTNLTIQNNATAGLYNYTPYQPNAAALNNLYGTGDGCSAYGNRNFWRMFNDWFGTTRTVSFSAQPVWQAVYTNNSKTTSLGWNASLTPGQTAYAVVQMRNTGNTTWTRSGGLGTTDTRLVTYGPWGRTSAFCPGTWVINCNRPAAVSEASVAPGQVGTFEFPITAPSQTGLYNETFSLVVDGRTTFSSGVMNFQFNVHN